MSVTSTAFKIEYTDVEGKNGTLTINKAKTGIDEAALGAVSDSFERVGYTIKDGYYYTTTKGDVIEPENE